MNFDLAYRLAKIIARLMIPVFGRFDVTGVEHVPQKGPVIIAANHQSYADPPIVFLAVRRPLWFMAKEELFRNPAVGFLLRQLHAYPVGRSGRDREAASWALDQLAAGLGIVLFPEATRRPGAMGPGTNGLAFLAARSGAPVIPVGITGTEHMVAWWRIPFPFCRIKVVIGEPVTVKRFAGRVPRDELSSMTETVMRRIAELLPVGYRGVYADLSPPSG